MPKIRVHIDFSTDDITSSTGQQLISHVLNFGFNPEYHVSLDLLFQYRWIWSFRDSLLCLAFILITIFCIIFHKHIPQRIYWQHNINNNFLSSPWNYELKGITLQSLGERISKRSMHGWKAGVNTKPILAQCRLTDAAFLKLSAQLVGCSTGESDLSGDCLLQAYLWGQAFWMF